MTEPTHITIVIKGRVETKGNWIDDASRFLSKGERVTAKAGQRALGWRQHCLNYGHTFTGGTATATPLCHSEASQSGSAWSVLPAIQRPRLVITLLSGGE